MPQVPKSRRRGRAGPPPGTPFPWKAQALQPHTILSHVPKRACRPSARAGGLLPRSPEHPVAGPAPLTRCGRLTAAPLFLPCSGSKSLPSQVRGGRQPLATHQPGINPAVLSHPVYCEPLWPINCLISSQRYHREWGRETGAEQAQGKEEDREVAHFGPRSLQ